jgi:hypothetical protein
VSDFTDKIVTIRQSELTDLMEALKDARYAMLNTGNAWGQQDARDVVDRLARHGDGSAAWWVERWYGFNHQRIKAGDTVRYDDGGSGMHYEAKVIACYVLGALVEDENGIEWRPWHRLHRLDRLHSEPDFDVANFASIARHMGFTSDPATWPAETEPPLHLGGVKSSLRLVDHWPTNSDEPTAVGSSDTRGEPRRYGTDWLGAVALDLPTTSEGLAEGKAYVDGLTTEGESSAEGLHRVLKERLHVEADRQAAYWSPRGISDLTDEEFADQLADKLATLVTRTFLHDRITLVSGEGLPAIDLFGYGRIPVALDAYDTKTGPAADRCWFWLHEAAEVLGWDPAEFEKWAREHRSHDLRDQRTADEETGTVGWQHLRHLPMDIRVNGGTEDAPLWIDLWLLSTDRLMSMMLGSPWSAEFFDAVTPLMAHGFAQSGLAEKLADVKSVIVAEDGTVTEGPSLADAIAEDTEGLSEEEARERAFRGPVAPTDEEGDQ